ncbi:putative integral membrane protein [Leishmania donovani]|uniref:Putative integral membrane protein n=1 Tax=Leishmania donovani TaxID=5661 RepID=A0A504XWZ5_LEIDO|nr:putative integral membrane protein [Leishmania donovani]
MAHRLSAAPVETAKWQKWLSTPNKSMKPQRLKTVAGAASGCGGGGDCPPCNATGMKHSETMQALKYARRAGMEHVSEDQTRWLARAAVAAAVPFDKSAARSLSALARSPVNCRRHRQHRRLRDDPPSATDGDYMVIAGANSLSLTLGIRHCAFAALRMSHTICMTLRFTGTIIGVLILSFVGDIARGNDTNLLVVFLIGIAFMETSSSYGETVDLLFVQRYPPPIPIFLITLPVAVVHWFIFTMGLLAPHNVVAVAYADGRRPPEEEGGKMDEVKAMGSAIAMRDLTYMIAMNPRGLFRLWDADAMEAVVYIAEDVAHFMALFGCYCKVPREGSFRVAGPSTITSIIPTVSTVGWLALVKAKFVSIPTSRSFETGVATLALRLNTA